MIVMKFGGTSVDGAARLAAAARVVASRRTERPVVVTSAMAGVTNTLEALLSLARRADRAGLDARLEELRARHLAAAEELAPGDAALAARLEERLRDLRVLLRGVRLVGVEGGGRGTGRGEHAATMTRGRVGAIHGFVSMVLQDDDGALRRRAPAPSGVTQGTTTPARRAPDGRAARALLDPMDSAP